jgi:uncharacterized membrane protein (UPF0182 family)
VAIRTPGAGLPARPRLLTPVLVIVAVLLILGGVGVALYTDLLWFREVGFSEVFTTVLRTKVLLFVAFGLLMAVLVGINVAIAYRTRPPFRPMSVEQQNLERYRVAVEPYLVPVLLVTSGIFGLFAGLSAASRWQLWMLWRNATPFGQVDPQFHKDISYFAMIYPFQRFVLGFVITAVVLSLIVAAATHYLFGGLRLQTAGDKVSAAARVHLSVLLGLVVLLKAAAYWLDRYGLAFSLRGVVQGASFTDVNAVLPAKNILVGIAVICALLFFANIVVRNVLLPAGALALLVVSAVVIGGIYPAYTQQFRVKPNEVQREAPYIKRNIEATRAAYAIDKAVVTQYAASTTATPSALRADTGTIPNARLLDPNVIAPTFQQFQRIRSYFGFNNQLDIDRYTIDGKTQDYIVAARELDQSGLNPDQRNWINLHLTYTHGNGFVAAPANTVDAGGRPVFAVGNVPPTGLNGGPSPIRIDQPRVYYGEKSPEYSVVRTKQLEIDGPGGNNSTDQATSTYDGTGGVQLSSPIRKLAYALKFREKNLLLSNALTSESRLMYIRTPKERVQKVAPFLQLDEDPYPAVVDGKIVWIVDGYTTSDGYPYAQRTNFGTATADSRNGGQGLLQQQVNYIRNSVKATVDAYTGKVSLYTWDEKDPVLKTWAKAFPGVMQPKSAISPDLLSHLRYPEDLFKVQRDLLAQYHVQDAQAFYNKEDFWAVPADPSGAASLAANSDTTNAAGPAVGSSGDQPPYYALLQVPGGTGPRFSLTTSFVARGRPNLTAFAAVSSDTTDYGNIRVLQVPRDTAINGPGQVAGLFESSPQVAESLSLLRRGGSQVTLGNLLTLPVSNGLLYIEPVYVKASGGESYPLLQRVIVSFGDKIAFEPTLQQALDALFGQGAGAGVPAGGPSGSPAPSASPGTTVVPATGDLAQAIAEADAAFRAGQTALQQGNFAAYGQAQERLKAALQRLSQLAPKASAAASPAPSTSASPR